MAKKISWIEAIPEDAREELIHDLSENKQSDLVPLQINDNVYWIPMEVNMLITALEEKEVYDLDPLQSQVEYQKIKGKRHYIYDHISEFYNDHPEVTPTKNWRDGNEGDWVWSDDKRIIKIIDDVF